MLKVFGLLNKYSFLSIRESLLCTIDYNNGCSAPYVGRGLSAGHCGRLHFAKLNEIFDLDSPLDAAVHVPLY